MKIIRIEALSDPRLAPYLNLKDRELAADGERFIAEGLLVVQRLLGSNYPCESVLCADRKLESLAPLVKGDTPLYVVSDELLNRTVGWKFHTGALAVGRRLPPAPLEAAMPRLLADQRPTLVVVPRSNNLENTGSIARLAAAFGARGLLLGPQSADPFYRQSIRTSMGTIFSLELHRSSDLLADLRALRERWKVELIASVLDRAAEPLAGARRGDGPVALLFGPEADGLAPQEVAVCQRRVTIPMSLGVDSLNVSLAAGIFLYHFTQLA